MNVSELLIRQGECLADATAIYCAGREVSYRHLAERLLYVASGLESTGVGFGNVVGLALDDPLDHLIACLSVAHLGATALSLPRSMPEALKSRVTALTRCDYVVGDTLGVQLSEVGTPKHVTWAGVLARGRGLFRTAPACTPDTPWLYVVGSGSTGSPKVMPVSHRQQLLRATIGKQWLPYGNGDVLVSLVSMHFYAAKQRCLEAFAIGATVYMGEPNRLDYGFEVERRRVSVIYGTVYHVGMLMRQLPRNVRQVYRNLTALMIGGSTVQMQLREEIRHRLTEKLYVVWGTNESHTATVTTLKDVFSTQGGVGRPLPGFRIEIVDSLGRCLPAGNVGRIRVSSSTMIDGYLAEEPSGSVKFQDGWFDTGDLGLITDDGQLIHKGRADDMMIVNGINVFPASIEEALLSSKRVIDVAVIAFKHEVMQDAPFAVVRVLPGSNVSEEALLKHVHEQLGKHALLKVLIVDRIPRNDQGKLQRDAVVSLLKQRLS